MKTNPTDRMKDPFYAQLIFFAEDIISQADQEAKNKGIQLNDSQVRSAVIKAMKSVQGKSPEIPKSSERDNLLAELIDSLVRAPQQMRIKADGSDASEEPLDNSVWSNALDTVADSIKTRKGDFPGSRFYLDFIQDFIAKGKRLL